MRLGGAVVGHQLARLDPARQLLGPATPDPRALGVLRPGGELAVQEHRHAQLLPDDRCRGERVRDRRAAALLVEVHHGHHVERAHVRVDAGVGADVDARDGRAGAADQGLRHVTLARRESEHGPVVIGIGVEGEEARGGERAADRLERREVLALAHVRHSHQERPRIHGCEGYSRPGGVGFPPRICRLTRLVRASRQPDDRGMCSISHRSPFLLALAVAVAMACSGGTPAMAACSPGAADKPDLAFKDSNCDGNKAAALFVAPGGNDAADGSFGHPKATVAAAVTAGLAANKDVYVAAGTYDGKLAFLGSTGHIGVYGGYDPQTWARSEANVATIRAPGQVVGVAAPGIVLQLLKIQGVAAGTTTSYGVRAFYSGSVALSRTIVEPSAGGDGANGADAPQSQPAA